MNAFLLKLRELKPLAEAATGEWLFKWWCGNSCEWSFYGLYSHFLMVHATAAQRFDAMGKTLGLWT